MGLLDDEEFLRSQMRATPRNQLLGLLSDVIAKGYSPERTQQMQGLSKFLGAQEVSQTLDRLSYGEPLTTGAGGIGGTTRVRPEALDAAMAAMNLAPLVGPTARVAGKAAAAGAKALGPTAAAMGENYMGRMGMMPGVVEKGAAKIKAAGFDPIKMRTQYPDQLPPVLAFDKVKQKEYLAKNLSDEAKAVQKASNAAQKDIDKGNYTPYFDVQKRYFADPAQYNLQGETLTQALPKRPETIAKYKAMYDTPKSREKLSKAYEAGKLDPNAENWYAMGQLEDEYIKRLGAEKGRQRFKDDFADAMASTTGGADPTSNFQMGSYGNYLRDRNIPVAKNAYDYPYPIGGRYASGNMSMYDKVINKGAGLSAEDTPKRFDFSANFLGDMNRGTIDEQMMTGIYSGLKVPAGDSYGIAEQLVHDLASQYGVKPGNFQDVTWKGLKGVPGMPMIEHINQSIERTARITNQTPEQVLDAFIRKRAPMYSAAPFGLLGFTPEEDQ